MPITPQTQITLFPCPANDDTEFECATCRDTGEVEGPAECHEDSGWTASWEPCPACTPDPLPPLVPEVMGPVAPDRFNILDDESIPF